MRDILWIACIDENLPVDTIPRFRYQPIGRPLDGIMKLLQVLVSLSVFLVCACSDSSHEKGMSNAAAPSPDAAPKRARIALVLKALSNPFFIELEKGARRAEKEFGIILQVKTSSQETDIEQQIQIVEEFIEQKVDALVIAPGDSKRLIPILKKAQNAGIVIINIDNPLDQNLLKQSQMRAIPFVSVDNEEASYRAAKFVAEKINKPMKAVILEGMPGAENSRLRTNGAVRALQGNPLIQIVAKETAHWKIDEAYEVTKRIWNRYPDAGILFCDNDMMALGAIKYLQESGRKNVSVIGYDALNEARAAIAAGAMTVTVDQQAAEQGYQGVALAVRALKGGEAPTALMVDAHLVTAETLK